MINEYKLIEVLNEWIADKAVLPIEKDLLVDIIGVVEEQPKICEWVSVNDAVPYKTESEFYDIVRVKFDDGSYGLGVYREGDDNEWWTRRDEGVDMGYSTDRIVTRWCYLPEYLEEDNE